MSIEIKKADEDILERWNKLIESNGGSFFHQLNILHVIEKHSNSTLHPLVGFKGQEPIGIFPLFELSRGWMKLVFSPPPELGIPGLGPILLNSTNLKQRKFEKRNKRFVEGSIEWIEQNIDPSYIHIQSIPRYNDPRPFKWTGFKLSPNYTYHTNIQQSTETVINSFSRDARSNIQNTDTDSYEIHKGDESDVRFVVDKIEERYEAQGKDYTITQEYVVDIFNSVSMDKLQAYIGTIDGERVSGILSPRFNDTIYFWQGGGKPQVSLPMNDLIHWKIIQDGISRNFKNYDLVGANTHRLCEYKSKFNPNLKVSYTIERGSFISNAAISLYGKL